MLLSIVVPVFNEEESIEKFYEELEKVIIPLKEYEIIFIDDGSTDTSLQLLKAIEVQNKKVIIYSFRKNQGKAEALSYGFQKAKGNYIATLDADLQDKPSEVLRLLPKVKTEADVVCGWRKHRQDPQLKILSSRVFNKLAGKLWGLSLHDYNCGLKMYTSVAAKSLRLYGGLHRFIPLLAYEQGFTVIEEPVIHEQRKHGKSKYGFSKLWKDLPDIFTVLFLTKYSKRPLHFFGMVGGVLLIVGMSILFYLSVIHFQGKSIGTRPLLFFGMILVLSGFQVFFTGFLADLILNLSHKESREFPLKYTTEKK